MADPTADTYGPIEDVPAAPAEGQAATDPALSILLDYFKAILNARLATAWESVAPTKPVVRQTFPYDPEREWFSTKSFPALYGHREGGQPTQRLADDWQTTPDTVVLTWIFPLAKPSAAAVRRPMISGLSKVLDRAVTLLRDPAYVDPTDDDVLATTYKAEPEAIKLKVSTSLGAQSYTGADLDGVRGGTTLSPPRGFEVKLTGSPSDFTNGSTITITGTNALDLPQSVTLTIDTAQIPYTLRAGVDFKTVTQIDVEGQATGGGFLSFGVGARAGYGSALLNRAGLVRLWTVKSAHPYDVTIRRPGQDAILYPAVRWSLGLVERLVRNPLAEGAVANDSAETGTEATLTTLRASDNTIFQTAAFPHGTVDPPDS